ncbi:two-component system, sensor histidine kinase [Azospirillaceae bacterium]
MQSMNRRVSLLKKSFFVQWLCVTFVVIALGGLIAFHLTNEYALTDARERERLQSNARIVSRNLSQQLMVMYTALAGIRGDVERDDGAFDSRFLKRMGDLIIGVRTILVTDSDGVILYANRSELLGKSFSHREWFSRMKRQNSKEIMAISPPFVTSLGVYSMNVSLIVIDNKGEFRGVVSATLDPDYFSTLLESVIYTPDMWLALAHGEGVQFMMTPPRAGQVGKNLAQPGSFFSRHRDSGMMESVMTGVVYATGEERVMVLETIQPAGVMFDFPLVVAVGRRVSEIFAGWRYSAEYLGGVYVLFSVLLIVGVSLAQRRRRSYESRAAQIEQELKENSERLKLAFDAAGIGVWEYVPQTGRVVWDAAMMQMYGVNEANFTFQYEDWRRRVVPEDLEKTQEALKVSIEAAMPFDSIFRIRRGDTGDVRIIHARGRVRFDSSGCLARVIGADKDITLSEQSRRALADRERFLKMVTDAIPGMVAYWNSDLRCVFANASYLLWFGKKPEEIIGVHIQNLLGLELFRRNEPFIRGALQGERQQFERTLIRTDGSTSYTWAQYLPDIEGGEVRGFFVLVTDVTEMKNTQIALENLNEELKTRTEQAEVATKIKSAFLANMSHEIRTPITGVLGMADLLRQTSLTSEQIDYLDTLSSSARSLLVILNDILDLSKMESGMLSLENVGFDLHQLVDRVVKLLKSTISVKDIDLVVHLAEDVPVMVVGDPGRLQQILYNLIGNAIKFTEKGFVSLCLSLVVENGADEERKIETVCIEIEDTGIGIPADRIDMLFRPFSQIDESSSRRFGGAGLGLVITKRLVEVMGGRIGVKSVLGVGSTFWFTLPFQKAQAASALLPCVQNVGSVNSAVPAVADANMDAGPCLRILLAEDNLINQRLVCAMLEKFGHCVVIVDNGREAVEAVEAATFDVVLMDMQMPEMDGETATMLIRALPPLKSRLPIFAFTADVLPEHQERYMRAGVDGFVPKPIDWVALREILKTIPVAS